MKCRLALFAKALVFPVTVAVDRNSTLIFSRVGRISPAELTASAEAPLK